MMLCNLTRPRSLVVICFAVFFSLLVVRESYAQISLRQKIGQMVLVTFTGDAIEKSSASLDTMKSDLASGNVGGVIMYTWSNNLNNPSQILHLTQELQKRSSIPLFIAIDEEGGQVARLGNSNGFAATPSAFQMGSLNQEANTRSVAATMAGWFVQTGLNVNFAPVVDVNVNPTSPAIGALGRSFSADPNIVASNASWFIDEFHKQRLYTTLKHFPGHGSATADSHLGLVDITNTWSSMELSPYRRLIGAGAADLIMTAHVFNAHLDSLYPATLSQKVVNGLLRDSLGYHGVVVSDEMSMAAIVNYFGFDDAIVLAVKAGVDILLYNSNLLSDGSSLARHVVDLLEKKVKDGTIDANRIDESYQRIIALKQRSIASYADASGGAIPEKFSLSNFPNPFNPSTTIILQIPQRQRVQLKIYDMLGREIATLLDEELSAGIKLVRWNTVNNPSGIYIAQARTVRGAHNLKMILLK